MKTVLRTLLFLCAILLLGSPTLSFEVLRPGEFQIPEGIRTIAIVDRSLSTNGFFNFIEKGPFSNFEKKPGWSASLIMDGLQAQINASGGVEARQSQVLLRRDGRGTVFGPPLEQQEVRDICRELGSDALICIELVEAYQGATYTEVRSGFRLYAPGNAGWIDQYQLIRPVRNRQKVTTPEGRTYRIDSEEDAEAEACYQAGLAYGKRILPAWYPAERIYFSRSKRDKNLSEGARLMEINQWNQSIAPLMKALENGHRKTRGKAAHNLAVAYEALGQYGMALDHARIAWADYKLDASKVYALELEERIEEVRRIKGLEESAISASDK